MSKKNSPKPAKGFTPLAAIVSIEPGDDIVNEAIAALVSIPAVSVFTTVADLRHEVDLYDAATKDLEEVKGRISSLQGKLASFRAALKSKIMNSGDITKIRVYVEKNLGDAINDIVENYANSAPSYVGLRNELTTLVAKANEMTELRQRADALETEAQSLLASVVTSNS